MRDVSVNQGRTVLFVSHNLGAIRSLCQSAILLEHGCLTMEGPVEEVTKRYEEELANG
ncbi:MAG: hypothetical protein BWX44_00618 [Spirochaetes bacterium ADurb.Bin001]|nr:MAG: hypothetical protein BWX44_00618 [Spirochaetes bacterium ADurb.Bin001]